jgi:hypothetical protein
VRFLLGEKGKDDEGEGWRLLACMSRPNIYSHNDARRDSIEYILENILLAILRGPRERRPAVDFLRAGVDFIVSE